jgi:hypothetical protein
MMKFYPAMLLPVLFSVSIILLFLASAQPPELSAASHQITINPYIPNPEFSYYKVTIDNGLKIYGFNWSATFQPYFLMNSGIAYAWSDIPSSIQKDLWKTQLDETHYKYGADFNNVPASIKNNLKYVILHRTDAENLTWDDVRLEGSCIFVKEKVSICHDDILASYTIPLINKTDIVIGNLTANWLANADGTFNISFDPTITITSESVMTTSILVNVMAEAGNSDSTNFTHLNMSTASPYDKLLGYWNFDGDKPNSPGFKAYDLSSGNRDGTAVNDTYVDSTNCVYGSCAKFDGNDTFGNRDYINLANKWTITGNYNITISVWVNPHNAQKSVSDARILSSGTECLLRFVTVTDRAEFILNSLALPDRVNSLTNTVKPEVWTHIAGVYNGTSLIIYINGTQNNQSAGTSGTYGECKSWEISASGTAGHYNGSIDELMFFNTSLSSSEILDIYNNQSARFMTTGTQTLESINLSATGTENRVNITLGDCETNLRSNLSAQLGIYIGAGCMDDPGFYVEPDFYTCANIGDEAACLEQSNCAWTGTCDTVTYPDCNAFQSQATCEGPYQADVCTWHYKYNQTEVYFNDCSISNYTFASGTSNVSLRLTFYAGNSSLYPFYSPLVIGNITLVSWTEEAPPTGDTTPPNINHVSPTGISGSTLKINVTSSDSQSNISVFTDIDYSLLLWLRMDGLNASGGMEDNSSYADDCNITGGQQIDSGKLGKAWRPISIATLTVGQDAIDCGKSTRFNVTSKLTLSGWFNVTGDYSSNTQSGIRRDDSFVLPYINAPFTTMTAWIKNSTGWYSVTATTAPSTIQNKWAHLAMTYNGSLMSIYINGILENTTALSGNVLWNTNNLWIGKEAGAPLYFNGSFDDILIFNRSLSKAEIQGIYANQTSKSIYSEHTVSAGDHNYTSWSQDTSGNVNSTTGGEPSGGDTCSCPASGNWNGNFADNCTITNCNMQGNNISISGAGRWVLNGNVTNYNILHIEGLNAANPCVVTCTSTGCFRG